MKKFICLVFVLFTFTIQHAFACYVWLTDGNGEEIGKTIIKYPNFNQGIYLTGCTFSSPFSAVKLYIVGNDAGVDENSYNGTVLTDLSGSANTIASFISCGYIQDELIASSLSMSYAEYDIVIDRNMNGIFDTGIDCMLNPGADYSFIIVPPQITNNNNNTGGGINSNYDWPFGTDNMVNKIKSFAAKEAQDLDELHDKYKNAKLALLAFDIARGATVGFFYSVAKLSAFRPGGLLIGQFASSRANAAALPEKFLASQAADIALENAKARYISIAKDPPRNDYSILSVIDSVDLSFEGVLNDSISAFIVSLENLTLIETRALAAELLALERLQGATIDSNRVGGYLQSTSLLYLYKLKQQIKIAKVAKWQLLKKYMGDHTILGPIPTESYLEIKNNLINGGFEPEHTRYFEAFSFTPEEINTVRSAIISSNPSKYEGKTYQELIDEIIQTESGNLDSLTIVADSINALVNKFGNTLNTSLLLPSFKIDGPTTMPGRNNSNPGSSVLFNYADINQSGTVISAGEFHTYSLQQNNSGTNITYSPLEPGFDLIRLKIQLANGLTAFAYHLIEITPGIASPKIIAAIPDSFFINHSVQNSAIVFKVTEASSPSGFSPKYSWYVNDLLYSSNADSLIFTPLSCTNTIFNIKVVLSDIASGNFNDVHEWQVKVSGDPSLCANKPDRRNATYWYFGNNAAIKFGGPSPVALTNSAMSQFEGVATMSDSAGNLLLYTNGITVYNRNHVVMQNGSGLTSNSSNTQAAMIIPYPGKPEKYLIITPDPYYYSVVDMTLDDGNGGIIPDQKNILLTNERSEKVAAVYAANQKDIWLITCAANEKRFNVFLVNESGILPQPVVSQFNQNSFSGYYGYMKASPNGRNLVTADFNQFFHLFDFDNRTGMVSNLRKIVPSSGIGGFGTYGIEFSPDGKLVYTADHRGLNRIYQFNIGLESANEIGNSMVSLMNSPSAIGALQLGPDGKIYVAKENGYLGVIKNPNRLGLECDYVPDGVFLNGRTSSLGLPGFISSILISNELTYEGTCASYPTHFKLERNITGIDSVFWVFGDSLSTNNTATGNDASHVYELPGTYSIRCVIRYDTSLVFFDTLSTDITINPNTFNQTSVIYFDNSPSCKDSIMLAPSMFGDGYQWYFNGMQIPGANNMSLLATETGNYGVEVKSINGCSRPASNDVELTFLDRDIHPTLVLNQQELSTQSFETWQWYRNDSLLLNENEQSIALSSPGLYYVVVSNMDGCKGISEKFNYQPVHTTIDDPDIESFNIFPNPVDHILWIKSSHPQQVITIMNMQGMLVGNSVFQQRIDVSSLSAGVYIVSNGVIRRRFVKK
jgi:hypothetical protein